MLPEREEARLLLLLRLDGLAFGAEEARLFAKSHRSHLRVRE